MESMMTVDEMLAGDWKLLIEEEPADRAATLSFADGSLLKEGQPLGTYTIEGDKVRAPQGEHELVIDVPDLSPLLPGFDAVPVNVLQANIVYPVPDDEPVALYASLTRVTHDRVADDEVRRRLAA
jgi:hypothetical protein